MIIEEVIDKMFRPIERKLNCFETMSELAKKNDLKLESSILKSEVLEANRYLSRLMEIPLTTKVYHIMRLKVMNELPVAVESSYFVYGNVEGIEQYDLKNCSLYEILNKEFNCKMKERKEEFRIVRATEIERDHLRVPLESSLLMIKGCVRDVKGMVVEYFENTVLPDLYVFKG